MFPFILYTTDSGTGGASHKEVMKLRRENQTLHEENNLLKLKVDILLDMVCSTHQTFKYFSIIHVLGYIMTRYIKFSLILWLHLNI